MPIERVYLNRDNTNVVSFKEDGASIDFTLVTRYLVKFGDQSVEADTDVDSSLVTDLGNGQLEFSFGGLALPEGVYGATVMIFDPAHPNGQVLTCEDDNKLQFQVVDC